ncbi:MAG: hypothetical protein ACSHYF_05900 [Verrucomicrobiaceae bacterium]
MKFAIIVILSTLTGFGQEGLVRLPARQAVPEEVMVEAQKATQALMNQVVRGNVDAAFLHMNPDWKKIEARKNGGAEKLAEKLRENFASLQAKGITLKAAEAKRPVMGWEVDFGHRTVMVDGVEQKVGVYKQWMVFVPTVSQISAIDRNARPVKTYEIRSDSFQVALCPKGANNWTFIDGADLKGVSLRQLFPYLPKQDDQLGLPKVRGQVIRER